MFFQQFVEKVGCSKKKKKKIVYKIYKQIFISKISAYIVKLSTLFLAYEAKIAELFDHNLKIHEKCFILLKPANVSSNFPINTRKKVFSDIIYEIDISTIVE